MKQKILIFLSILMLLCGSFFLWLAFKTQQYTVSFYNGDTLLSSQTLNEGEMPAVPSTDFPGLRFLRWDREILPAAADVQYHAVTAPMLSQHEPYLFPDDNNFLHPNDSFTGSMLRQALDVLGSDDAKAFFPELSGDETVLTGDTLGSILSVFFPEREDLPSGSESVTRQEAAAILNRLLERQETVSIAPGTKGFADVSPKMPQYADLLEASVAHESGSKTWQELSPDTGLTPGWELKEGRLRFVDDDGCLAINTAVNGLTFDADGYFTSGSKELDGYVTDLLASFQEEAPAADRMELLHMAYNHCRDKFMYLNREAYDIGATGWQIDDAIKMLSTGKGNCYKYTAAFWALARGLGYNTDAISGYINTHHHSWAIVYLDGNAYYCDPELEMSRRVEGKFDWDLFMRERSTMANWEYKEP